MPLGFGQVLGIQLQLIAQLMLDQAACGVLLLWWYLGRRGKTILGGTWQDPGQVGTPNQEGFSSSPHQPLATVLFRDGCPLIGPLKTQCGRLICHRLPLYPQDQECFVLLLTRWQVWVSCPSSDRLLFSCLRNICTLWWRFPKMRFLFWTPIWYCHSRQGHLPECLTWWWSKPQGECAASLAMWWWGEAGRRVASVSDLALHLTCLMTSNYFKIEVFLLGFIRVFHGWSVLCIAV